MSRQTQIRAFILVLAGIALIAILIISSQPDNRLVNTFESTNAFSFKYPNGWQYIIPEYNILLLGKPQTLVNQQPGPTLTIHRDLILSNADSLESALNLYLQQGPLNSRQTWKTITETTSVTLSNLPALAIELQGSERPTWPEFHSRITAVRARNGNVYLLTLSAPQSEWESNLPVLESILNSITITE